MNDERRHLIHILISVYPFHVLLHLRKKEKFYVVPPLFITSDNSTGIGKGAKTSRISPSINSYFNPTIPGKDKVSIDPRNSQSAESAGINSYRRRRRRRRRFCKTVPVSVPIFRRVYRNQPCQETSCRQKEGKEGDG